MKYSLLLLWTLQCMLSCNNIDSTKFSKELQNDTGKSYDIKSQLGKDLSINAEDILKDFNTWYNYTNYNIHLAQDFIGFDTDSNKLTKYEFLTRLTTGKFVPLKIMIRNNIPFYKLYKLNNNDLDIQATVIQSALHEISNYKMEGEELPKLNFTDLNGNVYNKSTTHQKIIVLKCWFIHCVACVKEFPELNKLVDEYNKNSNVLFISLAMDTKQDLISFLTTNHFKYAVIPEKKKYMIEDLGISEFPTHILIGKNGKIVKVTNAIEDIIPFLKIQTEKNL